MNVFVTGHRGYIGAHLVPLLQAAGHRVTGCDLDLFAGCAWDEMPKADVELVRDVRTLTPRDLDGYDCVMHLAAISNDPIGEDDALNPVSVYAESKIVAERGIAELADANFSPAYLRNATAYGDSPMLRIDLVVNNLLGCAVAKGDIRIMSDGTPWRPLIHCKDIARAFVAFLEAPREAIHNQAVNIGGDGENYRVRDIADLVRRLVPGAGVVYTGEVGKDPRDYRVDFARLGRLLPDFRLHYSLAAGMEELLAHYADAGFSAADFDGDKFVRLRTLRHRLDRLAATE